MPATLQLSALSASYGARPLFSGLDAVVAPGDTLALVGPNGAGKSTLLRIIAGEHAPDTGSVRCSPPDATIGYLPQSPPAASESILDYALRRTGVAAAQAAFETETAALAERRPGSADRYDAALHRWLGLGGADVEVRLAETVARVGLDADLDRPLGSLSGGQAARASLASILVSRFDVLLLDEPTNNLDDDGLALVTGFVRDAGVPVLLASHDRHFLDDVATSVLELDAVQQTVNRFTGGWSDYRTAREQEREKADEARSAYLSRRDALLSQAGRQTRWAQEGRTKIDKVVKEHGTPRIDRKPAEDKARRMEQRAARARAAAERLEVIEAPRKEWKLRYSIADAPPPAEVVCTLDEVVARAGHFVVGPFSASLERGDRVALLGANGSGKSTLLDALLGRRPLASGRLSWGTKVSVGVLDQTRSVVDGPRPLSEFMAEALGETDLGSVRTLLAKFGLAADHVTRPCETLSLGERTRAAMALLQGRAVNVLVLDEPTNHADVEAIESLEAALIAFEGTLVLVSHDRRLLEAVGITRRWLFERRGDRGSVAEA